MTSIKTQVPAKTQDSTMLYLATMNSTLSDLQQAYADADTIADISSIQKNAWNKRYNKAAKLEKLAKSPEGVKTISTLSNQAQVYLEHFTAEHDEKLAYVNEIKERISKIKHAISELETLGKMANMQANMKKMALSSNMTLASLNATADTPTFDIKKVDRLVHEAQALISIKK